MSDFGNTNTPRNELQLIPRDQLKRMGTQDLLRYIVRLETQLEQCSDELERTKSLEHNFRHLAELNCDYGYCNLFEADGTMKPAWSFGGFAAITGYDPAELHEIGGWPVLIHPEDHDAIKAHIERITSGEISCTNARIRTKSSEIRWIRDCSRPLYSDEGQLIGTYGSARDVTEEMTTRLSETQQRANFEALVSTPTHYALYRMENPLTPFDPVITHVSPSIMEILGISEEQMLDFRSWFLNIHPRDSERIKASIIRSASPPFIFDEVLEYNHPAKGSIWILARARGIPLDSDKEKIDFATGMIMDITHWRSTQEQLSQSEWEKALLMNSMEELFIYLTPDKKLKWCNRAAEQYLGKPQEELAGIPCQAIICKSENVCNNCPADEAGRTLTEVRSRNPSPDGTVWDVSASPLTDSDNTLLGYSMVFRDVTQESHMQKERESLSAQLLQAQKLESIGLLAGGIAHDFNNLLSPVLGYTEIMLDELSLDTEYNDMLQEIQYAARQAQNVTARLLAFSRKQELKKKPLMVKETIVSIMDLVKRTLRENITVQTSFTDDSLQILGDENQLHHIILNLAVNSQEAMPNGGLFTITASPASAQDMETLPLLKPGMPHVKITVSDTGCGISPDALPRVFDPFFTTRERQRGTGLGLATVHGMIQQHEGYIDAQSTEGMGTTFSLLFPRYFPTGHDGQAGQKLEKTAGP
ncbi:PAS domain-containing protein, partial [Myxococcota bacterium]|nr:PAS domain-containing protein [Myxococcota bacterium]